MSRHERTVPQQSAWKAHSRQVGASRSAPPQGCTRPMGCPDSDRAAAGGESGTTPPGPPAAAATATAAAPPSAASAVGEEVADEVGVEVGDPTAAVARKASEVRAHRAAAPR